MEFNSTFGSKNRGVQIGALFDQSGKHGERQSITDWLSPLDFCQKQEDVHKDWQPGTGEWFLYSEAFQSWKDGKNPVMWCHGIPGSGKTVMASIIVDHLRGSLADQSDVGIVPIYCEYQLKGVQTPENLLASFWRELSHSHDSIAKEVKDLYTKHISYSTKPTMNEIVSVVLDEIRKYSIVFVVVDALDECPEDGRVRARFIEELQHILTSTKSSKTKVRLLTTSRLTKHAFPDANELEFRTSDDDIRRFVCQRVKIGLSDHDEISQSIRQNGELTNTLAAMIVKRAGNMFLMAKLQLDSLATKTTLRSLRKAIQCAPEDLDGMYIAAWNRVNDQNRDSRHDAKLALCWLSCSFRQLQVQELRQALAIQEGDKAIDEEGLMNFDRLVRSCAGLVTVDRWSQVVRFIHQTAQDFFGTRASEFFPDAHCRITRTCLTYLHFDEFSQGPCDTTSALEDPIAETRIILTGLERNPFMQYAAHHWGDHARGEVTERALEREILSFLSTPRALASIVQVQYANAWRSSLPNSRRSLDSSMHTSIHVVVSFALEHILKVLLQTIRVENLNVEDESKKTAFHWAAELGLAGCARTLLEAGADIRTQDDLGCTAIYKASSFHHVPIVEMILNHNKTAECSAEEVACAILHSQKQFLERYIRSAPDPANKANSLLMQSLAEPGLIEFAISLGADVNFEDENGRTALLEAVDAGNSTAAKALIAAGASINVLGKGTGKTLLQVAASSQVPYNKRPESIRKIWHRMAEIVYQSRRRKSHELPVHVPNDLPHQSSSHREENATSSLATLKESDPLAALDEDCEYPDVIQLLLNNGANLGIKNSDGETLLHLAVSSAARIKVLLDMRAHELDVDVQDNQGRSALHHAAAVGNHAAMELLLANGASLELRDFGGASTLHYAVGHISCVELAIRKGSNTKAVDSQKRTALHYLTLISRLPQKQAESDRNDRINVSCELEEAGANINATDYQGREALDYFRDSSIDAHGFEETLRWIGMQLDRGLHVRQQARVLSTLKRWCEADDLMEDLVLFAVHGDLVSYIERYDISAKPRDPFARKLTQREINSLVFLSVRSLRTLTQSGTM